MSVDSHTSATSQRRLYRVSVNRLDVEPDQLRRLLEEAEVAPAEITKPGSALGVYAAVIADDPLGVERLRDLLKRNGIESFVGQTRLSTAEELLAAPLLAIHVRRAPTGEAGPRYGTQFDLSDACPVCGAGARPIGDVVLSASYVPKKADVFQTFRGEYFVSDRLRDQLVEGGVTGAEFHRVRAAVTGERLPFSQLIAPFTMPPADAERSGGLRRQEQCPACHQDGYFETAHEPLDLHYDLSAKELAVAPDLASTWEHFGVSRVRGPFEESVFAQPLLLARPKVLELLQRSKVRGLVLEPVVVMSFT